MTVEELLFVLKKCSYSATVDIIEMVDLDMSTKEYKRNCLSSKSDQIQIYTKHLDEEKIYFIKKGNM